MRSSWKMVGLLFGILVFYEGYTRISEVYGPGVLPDLVPETERHAVEVRYPATLSNYEGKTIPLRRGCSTTWDIPSMKTQLRNGADDCIGTSEVKTQCNDVETVPIRYSDVSTKKPWPWAPTPGEGVGYRRTISVIECREFYVLQIDTFTRVGPKTALYGPFTRTPPSP